MIIDHLIKELSLKVFNEYITHMSVLYRLRNLWFDGS